VRKVIQELRALSPIQRRQKRESIQFDRQFGVVTEQNIPIDELEAFEYAEYASAYQATPILALKHMLPALSVDFREYSFIDLGSGLGRALLLAAEFPFQNILGVEFSARLHHQACQNIEAAQKAGRIGENVSSVNVDATRFEFPDGKLIIYLFNPFQPPIIEKVLSNLRLALERHRREVFIIYCHPKYPEPFDNCPFLERTHHFPSQPGVFAFSIYQPLPA
jgi:SAM-dependent methyltransferase